MSGDERDPLLQVHLTLLLPTPPDPKGKAIPVPSECHPGKSSASLVIPFLPCNQPCFPPKPWNKSCSKLSTVSASPLCQGRQKGWFWEQPLTPTSPHLCSSNFPVPESPPAGSFCSDHHVQFVPSRLRSAPQLET